MNAAGAVARRERARHSGDENLYIVAYDIAKPQRWRKVFRIMEGYWGMSSIVGVPVPTQPTASNPAKVRTR
jgi:hypothetical protein